MLLFLAEILKDVPTLFVLCCHSYVQKIEVVNKQTTVNYFDSNVSAKTKLYKSPKKGWHISFGKKRSEIKNSILLINTLVSKMFEEKNL